MGILVVIFSIFVCKVNAMTLGKEERRIPPLNYDPTESGMHGKALQVNLSLWIESVMSVDMNDMEFTMHAYIIQQWQDARLAGIRNHSVSLRDRSSIYTTDLYCVNCKKPSLNNNANEFFLRLYPDGKLYYSQSATLSPSCLMNLQHFPFDMHKCRLLLASYGHNMSYMRLQWENDIVLSHTKLQQFSVSGYAEKGSYNSKYKSGNYTIMTAEITFTREQGFYILQVYVPCITLVVMSWIILYMSPDQVGDRLAIGVTLILTMIFLFGYVNKSLPKVSYIKALDWYLIFSLLCITASLIESIFVYWRHLSLHRRKPVNKDDPHEQNKLETMKGCENDSNCVFHSSSFTTCSSHEGNLVRPHNQGKETNTPVKFYSRKDANGNICHAVYDIGVISDPEHLKRKYSFSGMFNRRLSSPLRTEVYGDDQYDDTNIQSNISGNGSIKHSDLNNDSDSQNGSHNSDNTFIIKTNECNNSIDNVNQNIGNDYNNKHNCSTNNRRSNNHNNSRRGKRFGPIVFKCSNVIATTSFAVDKVCRVLFPVIFTTYTILYFVRCMNFDMTHNFIDKNID